MHTRVSAEIPNEIFQITRRDCNTIQDSHAAVKIGRPGELEQILAPSASLRGSFAARHCLGPVRMKSRRLYWLSAALLGSEWEGHPRRGRERFNLKSVQLTEVHSSRAGVPASVCVRETPTCGIISSAQPHLRRIPPQSYFSGAANKTGEALFLAVEIDFLVTGELVMHTNTHSEPGVAPSGAVVEQVASPIEPPGANVGGRLSPQARNLSTKTGSGSLPPDTAEPPRPRGRNISA